MISLPRRPNLPFSRDQAAGCLNHQRGTGRSPFRCDADLDFLPCLFAGLMTPRRHPSARACVAAAAVDSWPRRLALCPIRSNGPTHYRAAPGERRRLNAEQRRGGARRGCSVLCRLEDCYRNKINPAEAHQMAKQPTPDIASLRVRAGPYHGSRDISSIFWGAEAGVAPGL
jgi:hypothetical protein